MTPEQSQLWKRISSFQLDDPSSDKPFSKRLAQENNWSTEFTALAIGEYRKFIYLCCVYNASVVPSHVIDQVWHLHLIYTRSYWIDLCHNTLQKDIHHQPAQGPVEDVHKLEQGYLQTLQFYKESFGTEAPALFWFVAGSELDKKEISTNNHLQGSRPMRRFMKIENAFVLLALSSGAIFIAAVGNYDFLLPISIFVVVAVLVLKGVSDWEKEKKNKDDEGSGGNCTSASCGADSDGHHHGNDGHSHSGHSCSSGHGDNSCGSSYSCSAGHSCSSHSCSSSCGSSH